MTNPCILLADEATSNLLYRVTAELRITGRCHHARDGRRKYMCDHVVVMEDTKGHQTRRRVLRVCAAAGRQAGLYTTVELSLTSAKSFENLCPVRASGPKLGLEKRVEDERVALFRRMVSTLRLATHSYRR